MKRNVGTIPSREKIPQSIFIKSTKYGPRLFSRDGQWDFYPADRFVTAGIHSHPEFGVELFAQIRDLGRIFDHWRLVVGGSKLQQLKVPLNNLFDTTAVIGTTPPCSSGPGTSY